MRKIGLLIVLTVIVSVLTWVVMQIVELQRMDRPTQRPQSTNTFITRDQLREEFEQFRDEVITQRIIPLEDKTDLLMTRYNHAYDAS